MEEKGGDLKNYNSAGFLEPPEYPKECDLQETLFHTNRCFMVYGQNLGGDFGPSTDLLTEQKAIEYYNDMAGRGNKVMLVRICRYLADGEMVVHSIIAKSF